MTKSLVSFALGSFLLLGTENQVSEITKLKAELLRTKKALLSCQVSLANGSLSIEESKVLSEFKCESGFDWDKLECSPSSKGEEKK